MASPKALNREQLQSRKDKAVQFLENVVGDPDRAAEVEDESLEDYAEHRKIQILNPRRRSTMARQVKTAAEYREEIAALKNQISELEETNSELEDQLDSIADIVSGEEEEEEEEEHQSGEGDDDQN